ncbi:MAG: phosphohydrolase [Alphaproteobacteria bacterium 64-6]|nr:HD domain-containing protein [Hyphomicrobium sp.]OJU29302.1 MAG: phosphohydrolase [Alphaproteobacteria bacterium 64-6]
MDIVAHARGFASEKHRTQTRKYTNEPYVAHLDAVVGLLREQGITEQNIVAAAYLHDTVEDTDTSLQDIMRIFGDEIAQLVYWLTDAERGNRRARMAMASWRLGRAPWEAKLIKLADIIDNTRNMAESDPDFAPVFFREKREVLAEMAKNEGDRITNHPLYQRAAAQIMVTPT